MASHFFSGGNLETLLQDWARAYGPFVEWQVPGGPPVLVVTDPDAIREVYEIQQLPKSPRYMDLLPLLGAQSMVLTEGAVWKGQRDAFNPGFASAFLREAVPQFVDCTQHLVDCLEAAADEAEAAAAAATAEGRPPEAAAGAQAGVVMMHQLAILLTLEVILKVGFGEEALFLGEAGLTHPLYAAFSNLGRHVTHFLDNPSINWTKNLPWNKAKTERLNREYTALIMEILHRRLKAMGVDAAALGGSNSATTSTSGTPTSSGSPSPGGGCPMHAAVEAAAPAGCPAHAGEGHDEQRGGSSRGASPSGTGGGRTILDIAVQYSAGQGGGTIDVGTLRDQLMTFFAAGHDTTAALVAWTVNYLCQNPEAERKLAEEVASVLGPPPRADAGGAAAAAVRPSWQQLNEMRYMTCVLKETLRLRPPVGLLARWGPEGSSLRGYDTSGKVLVVGPYLQHTDPAAWGPDADQWRPERWEDPAGAAEGVHPYSYMPFSRGPRDCIGARFAMLEAKTILAMVYGRFKLEYAGRGPEEMLVSVTVHPKGGVPVRVTRR